MRIALYTLGCKLNQAETDQLREGLTRKGARIVPFGKRADCHIINACSVTEKSEKKTRQMIHRIKRKFPETHLIVTGCYTSGMQKNKHISEMVDRWVNNEKKMDIDPSPLAKSGRVDESVGPLKPGVEVEPLQQLRTRALVKIQAGCDNFCTYCIVPYLRKKIFNKPPRSIIREIKEKEKNGFKEVVLVGTNIGSYSYKLVDLLKEILAKTNIPRIRLSSLWPTAITGELLEIIKGEQRICPHLHLSIQSGCNKILRKMGRRYTIAQCKDIICKIRDKISMISISADIIVGFPAESEKDFGQTYDLIKSFPFLKLHIFRFSPRYGTYAAGMPDQIPDSIKKRRAESLDALGKKQSQKVRKKYLGRILSVLFESKKSPYWSGFSPNYLRVYVKSKRDLSNQIINVTLDQLYQNGLKGVIT